jgi:hypothetical protein
MSNAADLYRRAQAALSAGKPLEAQQLFRAAIDADPELPHPYFGLATVLDRSGVAVNRSAAARAYEQFITKAGGNAALGPQVAQARQRLSALRPPAPGPAPKPAPARPASSPPPQARRPAAPAPPERSSPAARPTQPKRVPPGLPTIRFERAAKGGGGVLKLFVDGKPVGQVRKGESVVSQIAPGNHVLEVRVGMNRKRLSLAMAAGDEAVVDVSMRGGLQISLRNLRRRGVSVAEPTPAGKQRAQGCRAAVAMLAGAAIVIGVLLILSQMS